MNHFFGILGGMGTLSTTNFITELNKLYNPQKDQDYFNYVLFNHAEIPDRTSYILDHSKKNPLPDMLESIQQLNQLNPAFIVVPCNTAHYFIKDLKAASVVPIIDMVDESLLYLSKNFKDVKTIGLAGTEGTIKSKLYQEPLEKAGYSVHLPSVKLQKSINQLIYDQVKKSGTVSMSFYYSILDTFLANDCDAILLCCTELSFANSQDPLNHYPIIDTEKVLLDKTVILGKQLKEKAK